MDAPFEPGYDFQDPYMQDRWRVAVDMFDIMSEYDKDFLIIMWASYNQPDLNKRLLHAMYCLDIEDISESTLWDALSEIVKTSLDLTIIDSNDEFNNEEQ